MVRLVPLALLLAGCLYTDDLNTPPTVTLSVDGTDVQGASAGPFPVGTAIRVDALPHDQEDGVFLPVTFTVFGPHDAASSDCEASLVTTYQRATVAFFVAGDYRVVATATDHQHARSPEAVVTLRITDPVPTSSGAVAHEPVPACGFFGSGLPIGLWFDGVVSDPRGSQQPSNPSCAALPSVVDRWSVSGGSHPVLTLADISGDCGSSHSPNASDSLTAPDAVHHVCLWPDGDVPAATSYTITFDARDSEGGGSVSSSVVVGPDQPPCITATSIAAGHYIVDHAGQFAPEVTAVADDRDPYGSDGLLYRWSVWRPGDPASGPANGTWTEVAFKAKLPSYGLDLGAFAIGDQVRLRVEAVDRSGQLASCPVGDERCCQASCNSADAACDAGQCQKWVTWDLELR